MIVPEHLELWVNGRLIAKAVVPNIFDLSTSLQLMAQDGPSNFHPMFDALVDDDGEPIIPAAGEHIDILDIDGRLIGRRTGVSFPINYEPDGQQEVFAPARPKEEDIDHPSRPPSDETTAVEDLYPIPERG